MVGGRDEQAVRVGRYLLFDELASGGMGSVHLGRMDGAAGFARCVALKRLHPHLAQDPEFSVMFLDEARLAARVRHPNVITTLDVLAEGGQLVMVMEYVQGDSLWRLMRAAREGGERVPPAIVSSVLYGALHGLHAAHEARDERGEPLGIVHRDVSPHNIIVGIDGVSRVLDFGVAKAVGRLQTTREGRLKGKISYMAPEQLRGGLVTRQSDVYAASVVLWESLTGERLFQADNEGAVLERVLFGAIPPPSERVPELGPAFDAIVMRGLSREREGRFSTAREMAAALAAACTSAPPDVVGEWVERWAHVQLAERAERVRRIESPMPATAPAEYAQIIGEVARPSAIGQELGATPPPNGSDVSSITVSSNSSGHDVHRGPRRPGRATAIAIAAFAILAASGAVWRLRSTPAAVAPIAIPSAAPPIASAEAMSAAPQVASSVDVPTVDVPLAAPSSSPSTSARPPSTTRVAPKALAPTTKPECKRQAVRDSSGLITWERVCPK